MQLQPVKSTNIKAVGHEGEELQVQFASGQTYRYSGVTAEDFAALLAADSIGKHMNVHIKPNFPASRVEQDSEKDGD